MQGPNTVTVMLLRAFWRILNSYMLVNAMHIKLRVSNLSTLHQRDQHFMVDYCFQSELGQNAMSNTPEL